jgi:hypothetical protein
LCAQCKRRASIRLDNDQPFERTKANDVALRSKKLMLVKAADQGKHHPAGSHRGVHMTSALHIVCPHCDSINRVPRERLRDSAKCGFCHSKIVRRIQKP